jgi:DNA-binding Lrp family transcriptional regulator
MAIAVSMVKVFPGHEKIAYRMLKNIEMIKKVYHIYGNHDFLLFLEAESIPRLSQLIDDVERLAGINEVSTILIGEQNPREESRGICRLPN